MFSILLYFILQDYPLYFFHTSTGVAQHLRVCLQQATMCFRLSDQKLSLIWKLVSDYGALSLHMQHSVFWDLFICIFSSQKPKEKRYKRLKNFTTVNYEYLAETQF